MSNSATPTHEDEIEKAYRTIAAVNQLKDCPAFTGYFMELLRKKQERIRHTVLNNEIITPEIREAMRLGAKEYDTIMKLADNDLASALDFIKTESQKVNGAPVRGASSM